MAGNEEIRVEVELEEIDEVEVVDVDHGVRADNRASSPERALDYIPHHSEESTTKVKLLTGHPPRIERDHTVRRKVGCIADRGGNIFLRHRRV